MNKYPLIIAHRGASAIAPENTIAAFRQAIKDNAEGIEFDVRLSKDGIPVVFHDPNLKRICGIEKKISELTFEELKKFDVGSWFNGKNPELAEAEFSKERVPGLEETLDFLASYKGIIYIELKCKKEEAEELSVAVSEIVNRSKLLPQIIIKSFKLYALPFIRKHCPKAKTAALFAPKAMTILRKEKRLIDMAKDLGTDRLSLHFSLATSKLMKKAVKNDLFVTIWTADNHRWIKRGLRLGIDHIITNNPARLLAKRYDLMRNGSILV